jgi:hypothetical protein
MLDQHPAVTIALDPLLPVFRELRNAIVAGSAPREVREQFDPNAPFQDYYFAPTGPTLLDCILSASSALPVPTADLAPLRERVVARAALESPALAERMRALAGADFQSMFEAALDIIASMKPGATWVGTKEVWVLEFVPLLARAFPEARFLAIERDPRAVVASLVAMGDRDPTQRAHPPSYMRHWRKSVALARRYEADPALRTRFRTVSYENLVANAEHEARNLCEELGLTFDPGMLELSARGWVGNSSYAHVDRDVYAGSTERWRTFLAPQIISTTDFLCGPEMALTAYRAQTTGQPDQRAFAYLQRAGDDPGSWRSDSGDLVLDWGGELLRHALLELSGEVQTELTRRCFLFTQTFAALRRADRSAMSQTEERR